MDNLEILNINRIMEGLHLQKLALKTQLETGIITIVDAVNETDMITKKERKLKEQLIKSVHVTENGEMRSIHHHLPTSGNPKDYYITKLDNGRKIKGASYESLLNKLYAHYSDGLTNFSVGMIFKAAIQEKEMTERDKGAEAKNQELSEMYNQVRYGGLHPDSDFLKRMKKL